MKCKCGRKRAVRRKGVQLPACESCWAAFLRGEQDPGTYAPRRDGLQIPAESTREWEREALVAAKRLGRPNPFGEEKK